jgi:mannosyl-3-phosphoglycerate phosphatase family protein
VAAIVFSDLDGTLLTLETYSCEEARPAVELLRSRDIPLVLCSSKTRAEIEHHRRELALDAPFIVENGSAIFIPAGQGCSVIELGLPAAEIRRRLADLRSEPGLDLRGYADLPLDEIRQRTGLDEEAARRASRREYSETLLQESVTPAALDRLQEALAACGLSAAGGSRFVTVTGCGADKGQATRLLLDLYRRRDPSLISVGLGDGPNDGPMLAEVDLPYLVQKPSGAWAEIDVPRLVRVEGVGPAGFRKVIGELFGRGEAAPPQGLRPGAAMG